MSEIERIGLIVSFFTGIITLLLQVWQRRDESKIAKAQVNLEGERHKLDIRRAESDIDQQQTDIQLRLTETLDAQMRSLNERYQRLYDEYSSYKAEIEQTISQSTELFDEFETIVSQCNGNGDCSNEELVNFLKKIRRFRRLRSI